MQPPDRPTVANSKVNKGGGGLAFHCRLGWATKRGVVIFTAPFPSVSLAYSAENERRLGGEQSAASFISFSRKK